MSRRVQVQDSHLGVRFSQPDDIFQPRVSLTDIDPPIWRRLLVPQDLLLPRLHRVVQIAMGWTDSHLHQFKVGDIRFGEPDDEFDPGPIDYRRITLNQAAPQRGSTCVYEYDFGDGWEHLLEVEAELPAESVDVPVPRCIAGEGACPPEDIGGPHRYSEVLLALSDTAHPEHDAGKRWAGPEFEPTEFDIEDVNAILASMHPRRRPGSSQTRRPRRG